MCSDPARPSSGQFVHNMQQPIPLGEKLRLLVRNMKIRVVTGKQCCGHPGEPGC
jgi:hypothetical protein